ncbi:MAG: DeoR/GlpR family DNA-binding transcription regulator [Armatimonadetes bacterium]|nr:DeoR/GlpR family DNA-binding transcription regulator [Armatimonadota bacterium]
MVRETERSIMLAAERRREIYNWALKHGSVNVNTLSRAFGVGQNTIRRDLDILHREGKLLRSYGGAIVKDTVSDRQPYSETRHGNIPQKEAIGQAALEYLPRSGSVFLGPGSTVLRLTMRIPTDSHLHVITNSPEVALHLVSRTAATVDLLGGRVRSDSYETDCSFSDQVLDMLYWDVTFMGASAVDSIRGMTSIDLSTAKFERTVIEHANKVVVLCDSSKLGSFSYVKVGPLDLIDVLITDSLADPDIVESIREQGVEVVLASLPEEDD